MSNRDPLSFVVGHLAVSQQSLDIIFKSICTNRALQEAGSNVMKYKQWVLFKASLIFAESIPRLLQQNVDQQGPVVGLMSGIEKYADFSECMEKVFCTLNPTSGTGLVVRISNNYLESHHDVLGLFVSVMAKHPNNAMLTTNICDNLAYVIGQQDMMKVYRSDSVTRTYGGIALKIFKDFPRDNACNNSASFLYDRILDETANAATLLSYPVSGVDLMSLMFEILRIESVGEQKDRKDNAVSLCTRKILLQSDWTVVMALTSPEKKHPVDVILDMMLVNSNRYACQYNGCILLEHYLRGTNKPHSVRACVQILTRLLRQCFNGTFYKGYSESRDSFFSYETGKLEMTLLGVLCSLVEHDAGCKDALIKYGTLVHVLDAVIKLQGNTFGFSYTHEYGAASRVEQREQSCIDYACSIIEHVSTGQDDARVYATLLEMDAMTTLLHTIEYQQHAKISRRLGRAHASALTSVYNMLTGMTLDATKELTGLKYEDVVLQNYAVGDLGVHRNRRTLCDFMFSHIDLEQETLIVNSVTRFQETLETQCNILLHMSRNPAVCSEMIAYMPHFVNMVDLVLLESAQY